MESNLSTFTLKSLLDLEFQSYHFNNSDQLMVVRSKKKKIILISAFLLIGYGIWTQTYSYNNDNACKYVGENSLSRSHSCCAWFVMRAMQAGGCPMVILPAWAYRYTLPLYGYNLICSDRGKDCTSITIKKGDIVVIPRGSYSFWGHIAMFDGKQWVSDFKQKHMSPYRKHVKYRIYRRKS